MLITNLDFQENLREKTKVIGGVNFIDTRNETSSDDEEVNGQVVSRISMGTRSRAEGILQPTQSLTQSAVAGLGFIMASSTLLSIAKTPNS